MSGQLTKQKLCWNCEAKVDFGVESCPSCGVYSSTSPLLEQSISHQSDNTYAPPYRFVSNETAVPESPYKMVQTDEAQEAVVEKKVEATTEETTNKKINTDLLPLGLLLSGTVFLLFGVVLFLFSENGALTLSWNGDYWFVYTFLGLPLLFFGLRALQNLEVTE